jgi:cell division transport system permease protein
MSLTYTIKESFSGFSRAKLSMVASIVTISVALLLLGVFAMVSIDTSRALSSLRDKFELEAFVREPTSRQDLAAIQKKIQAIEGTDRVTFVSKDEAAKIYKKETGEDINAVLQFNPLPPSYKVYLKDGYKTSEAGQRVYESLKKITGIEEVVYRKALVELIDKRAATANTLILILGSLIAFSAILLVYNTIRLAIYAKRRILRTMELVGATRLFVRMPFLLEGVIQGLIGGIISAGLLYVGIEYISRNLLIEFSEYIRMEPLFYAATVGAGICLGLIGAILAVVRFMRLPEA